MYYNTTNITETFRKQKILTKKCEAREDVAE